MSELNEMYSGKSFSPQTTLTADITATTTSIKVSDISVFPEAPNLATIGTDENAEVIRYSGISANTLIGCTRGVEGTAKAWNSGETIARYFTNTDYEIICENIRKLNEETSGGAKNMAYTVMLPPSSVYNNPTTWEMDTTMALPAGYSAGSCVIRTKGDMIYLFGKGIIRIGNLRTRTWQETDIATGFSYIPISACFYDDYKIFLVFQVNNNTYLKSFDTQQQKIMHLSSFQTRDPSLGYSGSESQYIVPTNYPAIFSEKNRKIYFFAGFGRRGYSRITSSDTYNMNYKAHCVLFEYSVDLNTYTSLIPFSIGNSTSGSNSTPYNTYLTNINNHLNKYQNSLIDLDEEGNLLYISNAAYEPTKRYEYNLVSLTETLDTQSSALTYYPTAWTVLDSLKLCFNGSSATLYDQINNEISSLIIPNSPANPAFDCLALWDNHIIFLHNSALILLPYITKAAGDNLAPVMTIFEGQQFCGTKELKIYNSDVGDGSTLKATVTKSWQTAAETFDIKLGEYQHNGDFRLLVRSGG